MKSVLSMPSPGEAKASFAAELLSVIGEGVWEWDLSADEVWHNRSWFRILGLEWRDDPHPAADFFNLVLPEDAERVRAELEDCLAGKSSYDCQFRMLHADGRAIWVHDRGKVVERADDGAPLRMAGSFRDITAQIEAETALRASETRFRDLANNIPGAIFRYILRPDGSDTIEYMSPGCLDIWEVDQASLQEDPTPLWEMVHPDDLPGMQQSVMGSAQTLQPWSCRWRITTPSGQKRFLHGRGQPEKLDDGSILWNSLVLDVTEQHKIEEEMRCAKEEAETSKRAMVEFLGHMSHELRTPLNAIIGFSEVMQKEMFGPHSAPRYSQYSAAIHRSASHLRDLLADLIDVSKIESGQLVLAEEWVGLPKVLDFCQAVLNERIEQSKLSYHVKLPSPEPQLLGDSIRIKQVLLNLIGNAAKFTSAGGRIDVAGRYRGKVFEVSIKDTGVGIAPEDLPYVTEAFRQVRSDVTRTAEGTGLGLFICNKIMQLHGGKLAIRSKKDEGTEILLTFPADRIRQARSA